jgi:hypothetical protein
MRDAVTLNSRSRALIAVLCFCVFAAMAAIAATLPLAHAPMPARAADVKLVYVGAEDCAPCRIWQTKDGAAFRQSVEFSRLTYIEVKARHLHDVLKDDNWPEQIRDLRSRLRKSDGVPLWLVVSNGEVVEQRFGAAAWHAEILPAIRARLR